MTDNKASARHSVRKAQRDQRLAQALRQNLRRRKEQEKARDCQEKHDLSRTSPSLIEASKEE